MTGDAPEPDSAHAGGGEVTAEAGAREPAPGEGARRAAGVEIPLEASAQGLAGWALFELGMGALLIASLGTVGVWVGVVLLVHGLFRVGELAQLLTSRPGRIVVSDRIVRLPRGRTAARAFELAPADVTAAYFLRRSVPWNHAAPVLVVEIGRHALAYPRDWFGSEADQRHAIHALLRGISPGATPAAAATAALETARRFETTKLALGALLLAGGVIAWVATSAPVAGSSVYAFYVAPIMAGVTLIWRWLTRL